MAKPRAPKPQVGVPTPGRNNVPILIGGLFVIVILAIVAIISTSGGDDEDNTDVRVLESQAVKVTGASLQPKPESGDDPAVGSQIPTIEGKTFTSEPVTISPSDGRAKVVFVVAHWCPHCRKEVPLLSDWISANKSKYPVDYYALSSSVQPTGANYPPSRWLEDEKFPAITIADDRNNTGATALGLGGFPYMIFVDKKGNIVSRTSGEIPMDQFETFVKAAAEANPA